MKLVSIMTDGVHNGRDAVLKRVILRQIKPEYMAPMHFGGSFDKAKAARADIEAQGVIYLQPNFYGDVIDLDLPLSWEV